MGLTRSTNAWPAVLLSLALLVAGGCARAEAPTNTPAAQGIRQTLLLRGLEHPWGLAWLPDGNLLITERRMTGTAEQRGILWRARREELRRQAEPMLACPVSIRLNDGGAEAA